MFIRDRGFIVERERIRVVVEMKFDIETCEFLS